MQLPITGEYPSAAYSCRRDYTAKTVNELLRTPNSMNEGLKRPMDENSSTESNCYFFWNG